MNPEPSPCRWCREGLILLHTVYFGAHNQSRLLRPLHARGDEPNHQELRVCNDPDKCITWGHQHRWQVAKLDSGEPGEYCLVCFIEQDHRLRYIGYPR